MSRRIITTENLEEDVKIESHLRPQLLDDYIGQEKAKEILKVYITAARERGKPWIMYFFMALQALVKQHWPELLLMRCM